MNSFAVIAIVAFVATANAGVLVGPSVKILQGPSSKTTLVGPEGNVVSAVAPGGQIVHEEHPGFVAHAAPVPSHTVYALSHEALVHHASPVVAYAAPVVAHVGQVVAHGAHVEHTEHATVVAAAPVPNHTAYTVSHEAPVAHYAKVVAHAAPVAHTKHATVVAHSSAYEKENVFVAGPSGTITTGNAAHVAPVVAHSAPVLAHASSVVAHSVPVVSHVAHAVGIVAHHDVDDNGHEGQYVHDHSESLYDDGSYKPHH